MEAEFAITQSKIARRPWTERVIPFLRETVLDEETGIIIERFKPEISPGELGSLMNISPQKATSILSQLKEDPNYERFPLRGGKCIYKLVC